jgi:NitT/TauT family transport system permease protein
MQGIKSVDNKMIEMSKVFHFNLTKRIKMIYWPEMKPYFFSSAAISFGIAWKSGISAEVLSSTKNSIGMSLYFSQTHLDTTSLFAWTIIIIIISYSLEKLIIRR